MTLLIVFILLLLVLLLLTKRSISLRDAEIENQVQREYLSSLDELHGSIQEKAWQNRKYRHDLEKHIRTLEALLQEQKDNEKMQQYSAELKESYQEMKENRFCSDDIINTILAAKNRQCREKQVEFQIQVEDTSYDSIKEIDLIGILENLLDNALEAQERIEESDRLIRAELGRDSQGISLMVENRIQPGERIDFKTKKANPKLHGVGTKIVDEIVAAYHGNKNIEVDREKNLLKIRIQLHTEK